MDNLVCLDLGLVYNRGEFVEGYSSPLWALLLIVLRAAGLGFWFAIRLVGAVAYAATWWTLVRQAHPYRDLPRADFDAVLQMLSEGVSTRRGRRSAHLHLDRVHGIARPRRGARLAAITSGGAIPDLADFLQVGHTDWLATSTSSAR